MELLEALEPWMIPIVVMVSLTAMMLIGTIGGIIKTSIKRKSEGNLSENREFLEALREFKENIDRRVTNLEVIIAGDETLENPSAAKQEKKKRDRENAIEIELDSHTEKKDSSKDSGKLRNMLNQ